MRTAKNRAEARQIEPEDYVDAILELCRTIDDASEAICDKLAQLEWIKDDLAAIEKHARRSVR